MQSLTAAIISIFGNPADLCSKHTLYDHSLSAPSTLAKMAKFHSWCNHRPGSKADKPAIALQWSQGIIFRVVIIAPRCLRIGGSLTVLRVKKVTPRLRSEGGGGIGQRGGGEWWEHFRRKEQAACSVAVKFGKRAAKNLKFRALLSASGWPRNWGSPPISPASLLGLGFWSLGFSWAHDLIFSWT